MKDIDVRSVTPAEMGQELDALLQRSRENKYSLQVALKDLEIDVDEDKREQLGVTLPFQTIDAAEQALRLGVIVSTHFLEHDGTEHRVDLFDAAPVGFSGFQDCVTHSLSLTDQGLFEVGRFSAVRLGTVDRAWQWFLHRRLGTPEEVAIWQQENDLSAPQLVDIVYETLTGLSRHAPDATADR